MLQGGKEQSLEDMGAAGKMSHATPGVKEG